jgi:hypothetical protein
LSIHDINEVVDLETESEGVQDSSFSEEELLHGRWHDDLLSR